MSNEPENTAVVLPSKGVVVIAPPELDSLVGEIMDAGEPYRDAYAIPAGDLPLYRGMLRVAEIAHPATYLRWVFDSFKSGGLELKAMTTVDEVAHGMIPPECDWELFTKIAAGTRDGDPGTSRELWGQAYNFTVENGGQDCYEVGLLLDRAQPGGWEMPLRRLLHGADPGDPVGDGRFDTAAAHENTPEQRKRIARRYRREMDIYSSMMGEAMVVV